MFSLSSVPTALAFAPDGRMFIAEKGGFGGNQEAHVWTFDGASLQRWLTLTVSTEGERGLWDWPWTPISSGMGSCIWFTHPLGPSRSGVWSGIGTNRAVAWIQRF